MSQDSNKAKIKETYLEENLSKSDSNINNIILSNNLKEDINSIKQAIKNNSSILERIQSDINSIKKFQFERLEQLFNGLYALCESFSALDNVIDELKVSLHL